jgi:methyl-accepting chemotaxis protein
MGPALALILGNRDLMWPLLLVAGAGGFGAYWAGAEQDMTSFTKLRQALRKLINGKPFERPEAEPDIIHAIYDELEELETLLAEKASELETAQKAAAKATRVPTVRPPSVSQNAPQPSDTPDTPTWAGAAAADELRDAINHLGVLVTDQRSENQAVQSAVANAQEKLQGLAEHVQTLANSADESSSSVLEMSATTDEVAENIGELASSVREMVASIEEMAFSIREVATNIDELSLTAEETSSSMNQMDVAIDQVQSNADETARLSEEVARDAEHGAESILKTMGEIYRIKESSHEALGVINSLGSRIEAIGEILNVIDDVAEQTNLLALNAAIIAAQAGEHGKGFAVVADEIKDLAERAGASTKEIAELIKTIQSESKNAIAAVEAGAENVDRGVEVSNEAERALKKILESSQKSTNMVRAIARATVEQAKGSKQVTDAISRIADTVQQIAAATAEQARGSELIMKSGEKMRTISQQVERSSQEQARGSRQITQAIEAINGMVGELSQAQRDYAEISTEALTRIDRVAQLSSEQTVAIKQLTGIVDGMGQEG